MTAEELAKALREWLETQRDILYETVPLGSWSRGKYDAFEMVCLWLDDHLPDAGEKVEEPQRCKGCKHAESCYHFGANLTCIYASTQVDKVFKQPEPEKQEACPGDERAPHCEDLFGNLQRRVEKLEKLLTEKGE